MAANYGVSDRVFQRHGHWRSVQARNLHVDDDPDRRFAVSKFLGLSESTTRTFSQFFVTLYSVRVGLVRPSQNKLIWFGDACVAFCCGDKISPKLLNFYDNEELVPDYANLSSGMCILTWYY